MYKENTLLKLCKYNPFYDEIAEILDLHSLPYTVEKCISRCNVCHRKPLVKINDYMISADDPLELLEKLKKYMA